MRKKTMFALALCVIALGMVLRSYRILRPFAGHHSWNEAHYASEARSIIYYGNPLAVTPSESWCTYDYQHTPLTDWFIALSFLIFGESEWAARMVTAIWFGLPALVMVFFIGRELWSEKAGLFSMFLYAVNPVIVYFTQNVQLESAEAFFVLSSIYYVLLFWRRQKMGYFGLACVFFALGCLAKYPAIFVAIPVGALLFMTEKTRSKRILFPLIFGFSGAMAIQSWAWFAVGRTEPWATPYGQAPLASDWLMLLQGQWWGMLGLRLVIGLAIPILLPLFFLSVRSTKDRRVQLFLIFWVMSGFTFMMFTGAKAYLHDYYIFPIILALILGSGNAVSARGLIHWSEERNGRGEKTPMRKALTVTGLVLAITIPSLFLVEWFYTIDVVPAIKEAGLFLRPHVTRDTKIMAYPEIGYYAHSRSTLPRDDYEYFIYWLRAHSIKYICRNLWLWSDGEQGSDLNDPRILKFLEFNCTLVYKTLNNSGHWYEIYEVQRLKAV